MTRLSFFTSTRSTPHVYEGSVSKRPRTEQSKTEEASRGKKICEEEDAHIAYETDECPLDKCLQLTNEEHVLFAKLGNLRMKLAAEKQKRKENKGRGRTLIFADGGLRNFRCIVIPK
ncbi:hypothetical protein SELMODRAFT_412735 [Selaginella moellendorffii]|uniref:Uncharacterized protein n=1 Tax=Selaginella moellendorffii TaxID=88036 RepID=D8RLB1_SELML|nr:hypothetical protein SELMODRAFT_412735 [Selaginella moellendorffii]